MKVTHGQAPAPAVPATARQGAEPSRCHPFPLCGRGPLASSARDWSWVEDCVWTERMVAALVNGVKGGCWFSLIDKVYAPATLAAAWAKVEANKGAAGVDGQSIERFAARSETYLAELASELRAGTHRPQAIRRVDIPKDNGRTRPLGIPTVKDRIVQTAMKLVIEPIFEAMFLPTSYGFRPGRGCKDALREADRLIRDGYAFVVDADLQSYFDSIPEDRLMHRVATRISDGRVLALLRRSYDGKWVTAAIRRRGLLGCR